MKQKQYYRCPWCGEDDFDLFGLKLHIINGWCEKFNTLEDYGKI